MDAGLIAGPSGAFLAVLLFAFGLHRFANRPGVIARRRVLAFAERPAGTAGFAAGSLLRERRRLSSIGLLDRSLQRRSWSERMARDLARAALPWQVAEYLLMRSLLAMLATFVLMQRTEVPILALAAGVTGYFLPVAYVRWRQGRRRKQFDDQLVEALVLIANALKSGFSFMQGMQAICDEMPAPIGTEFGQALGEVRAGGAVDDALLAIGTRVQSADFELVTTAMLIQRQVGGNLAEVLNSIVNTIRERHRIQREVKVLSAEQRLSGYVIGALPVVMVVLMSFLSPSYIHGMFVDPAGKLILAAGFGLELLGLLIIRRLMAIEV